MLRKLSGTGFRHGGEFAIFQRLNKVFRWLAGVKIFDVADPPILNCKIKCMLFSVFRREICTKTSFVYIRNLIADIAWLQIKGFTFDSDTGKLG